MKSQTLRKLNSFPFYIQYLDENIKEIDEDFLMFSRLEITLVDWLIWVFEYSIFISILLYPPEIKL